MILHMINAFALPFAMIPGNIPFIGGFGSGFGLSIPYHTGKMYWIRNDKHKKKPGAWYSWLGGFGAQLYSFEFFKPIAGTSRELFGHTFVIFSPPERRGFMYKITWNEDKNFKDYSEIEALKKELEDWRGY